MMVKVPRPEDPELAKLWDEARKAVLDRECCVGDVSRYRCEAGARQLAVAAEDES